MPPVSRLTLLSCPSARGERRAAGARPSTARRRERSSSSAAARLEGTGIVERFIQLAGGADKKFIIVPTAGGNKNDDGTVRAYDEAQIIGSWLKRGLKNVRMLHTHDPKVADTDAFVQELKDADAVWFNGGRQWNIVDSYADTRTLRGVPQGAGARRRDRRELRRRDDPGRVPRPRRHVRART